MGKGDARGLTRRRERKKAKRLARREAFDLAGIPARKPCGRRREPKGGWGRVGPTPEAKARREALLGDFQGCSDDWIDVAEAQGLFTARECAAMRRFRTLQRAYLSVISSPKMARDCLAQLMPGRAFETNAETERAIRVAYDDAVFALSHAPKAAASAFERAIRERGLPLPRQSQRMRLALPWVMAWAEV